MKQKHKVKYITGYDGFWPLCGGTFCISTGRSSTLWIKNGKYHRIDGPASIFHNNHMSWWIRGVRRRTNKEFQEAAGISDEDMTIIIMKYGNVS